MTAVPSIQAVADRLAAVERVRAKWKGNPAYLETLDVDIYALTRLLTELIK